MITIVIGGLLFLYLTYNFMFSYKTKFSFNSKDIVLIVIAHPDDECMFFAPTILNLLKEGYEIYLLCLSSGAFYKKSGERKRELRESCKILGIPSENVFIIEHCRLPDNPNMAWNKGCVAHIIRKYFVQLSAKIIFSFDEYGVSGHLNHIAICQGLEYLKAKELLPKGSQVFQLKSVLLLQKYLALLSVPICLLCSSLCFISTFSDIQKTWVPKIRRKMAIDCAARVLLGCPKRMAPARHYTTQVRIQQQNKYTPLPAEKGK